ncbi:hypothetical protein [Microbispora catharanthi]|uniref:Uncharacterized protein n=1 Tax=Microbispora catharanthi TaxID=1712871 RepID=A0A5N6BH61_9ACTN|nr:hypothetical protein [Microbispora catharanthi]KAB8179353.1 hypothetical protein FH610_035365 [Microbispora catharanthi]
MELRRGLHVRVGGTGEVVEEDGLLLGRVALDDGADLLTGRSQGLVEAAGTGDEFGAVSS